MLVTPLKAICIHCDLGLFDYLVKNHRRGVQYVDLMKELKKVNPKWRSWIYKHYHKEHIRKDLIRPIIEKEYSDIMEEL